MGKNTYYIVQTWRDLFIRKSDQFGYVEGFVLEKAAHLSLSEARKICREYKARYDAEECPRRFPRILKVTTEIKTITTRR